MIRYIGDWEEFKLPGHPHIMDKQIPGCGFTEWCLTNEQDVILCSPRNMLILNKWEQHIGEVFRVHNDKYDVDLAVDKDLGEDKGKTGENPDNSMEAMELRMGAEKLLSEQEDKAFGQTLKIDLDNYILGRRFQGKTVKILVTYDSFRILRDILKDEFDKFQVIVDEFQSVFTDSRFKANTEMEFVQTMTGVEKVCYVSATPMLDNYIEQLPEFKNLDYYRLDWETSQPSRIRKPNIKVRVTNSIYEPIKGIIEEYKSGKFEIYREYDKETGTIVSKESKEAMIYVNSVKNIIQIIKKGKLDPSEVNILCSNTPNNLKKIQKDLGKKFTIGKVPLRGEPRKMFTLCTRTVYLGADFYSDNARTFVLSDANIDCLAIDISLDLPQILGRQRLEENPWKNSAEFYYKTLKIDGKKITEEKCKELIAEKVRLSQEIVDNYEIAAHRLTALKVLEDRCNDRNYKDDYVGINYHGGSNKTPAFNYLVMIAEQRAFDIQRIDYKDRFSVFNTINNTFNLKNEEDSMKVREILNEIDSRTVLSEKLRYLCEIEISEDIREIVENQMDERIRGFLSLGKDKLKAAGYNTYKLDKALETLDSTQLINLIMDSFHEGDRMSRAEVKTQLKNIYISCGVKKSAKAVDLQEWFEIEEISFRKNGKVIRGIEIIKKKS